MDKSFFEIDKEFGTEIQLRQDSCFELSLVFSLKSIGQNKCSFDLVLKDGPSYKINITAQVYKESFKSSEAILWPITQTYYLRKTFVALLEQPIYWLTVKNIGFKLKNDDVEFSLVDIIENVV